MGKHENFGIEQRQTKSKSNGNGKKKKIVKRVILLILVLLLIACAVVFGFGYLTLTKMSNKSKVPAKKIAVTKPVNILVLGVDAGDYTNHTKNNPNRSDTMMLVRFNPKTGRVYMLSLPRDTKVKLNGRTQKLNAAHAIGGIPYTIKTIEKLINVDINYYVEINYAGFRECVDAIGGVDMVIPRDMNYDAWKISIHFKKGEKVHLNGEMAEEYVRWRKNNDGSGYAMGDLGRINTQQEFMVKLVDKIKSPAGLLRAPSLINAVSKYIETNMDASTMLSYAMEAPKVKSNLIMKHILPGEAKYVGRVSYYVWNQDLNDKFISHFRGYEEPIAVAANAGTKAETTVSPNSDKPVSTEQPAKNDTDTATDGNNDPAGTVPQRNNDDNNSTNKDSGTIDNSVPDSNSGDNTVKETNRHKMDVAILNSTGVNGLAAKYRTKLEKLGYKVTQTGNYPYEKMKKTIINDYSKSGFGSTLKSDLDFGTLVERDKNKKLANLVVILGADSIK